ncbi:hypothetical protein V6N11_031564 [Hibiscus sabdariffa]|uniref:Uncharacterized protein n=1 Tax=Hibiscus sabdariffa TaxID=183260 RepID=A0ABR2SY19_9ROSI
MSPPFPSFGKSLSSICLIFSHLGVDCPSQLSHHHYRAVFTFLEGLETLAPEWEGIDVGLFDQARNQALWCWPLCCLIVWATTKPSP